MRSKFLKVKVNGVAVPYSKLTLQQRRITHILMTIVIGMALGSVLLVASIIFFAFKIIF
jgi:hypothetical protein